MEWDEAKHRITKSVRMETDLNTEKSSYRKIEHIGRLRDSNRYGYSGVSGFEVRIGEDATISIPWTMLRKCFRCLQDPSGYDGSSFRSLFPKQAKDHGCHVHIVGMIFVAAGLAESAGRSYRFVDDLSGEVAPER